MTANLANPWNLTAQEQQVIDWRSQGLNVSRIAEVLRLSESMIRKLLASALVRMGCEHDVTLGCVWWDRHAYGREREAV